ncbi:MAG: hypothetical protein Phog2KO_09200 [Phototrophicaceae bacterium]
MLSNILQSQNGKSWIYLLLRLLMIVSISIFLFFMYPRSVNGIESLTDIAYPAIVGVFTGLIVLIFVLVKPITKFLPFLIIPIDWLLIATYIYFFPSGDLLMLTGITLMITLSGVLYIGALFGIIEAMGSLIVLSVTYLNRPDVVLNTVFSDLTPYVPALFFSSIILLVAIVWHASLDEENNSSRKDVRREIEESRQRVDEMRERTRAVADMAAELNSNLNFDRILNASLDVGRLSVRNSSSARMVSMALMVTNENGELTIETERGLKRNELSQVFAGTRGIIAKAINTGEPIIYNGGSDDPELKMLSSFSSVKSTLVIPLRANYETYGVLVFGSNEANAISEDHIDTLAAIGVQATVALQNAVLYTNLQDEKERILRIEENGRKALVRDLHDIPTQTVAAVAMHLSTIPRISEKYPERLVEEVENIRGMALRATEELRHVMFTIRPLSLEASGLTVALGQLAEKMEKTYSQPMQVKVEKRVEEVLDKDAKGSLFYLVEEAANNSRKYAKASMIQVMAGIKGQEVILKIRDNGKGFDMGAVGADYENRGSFGMVNMRERAELINGTFELQSAVGKGTIVTVRVPLKDDNVTGNTPTLKPRRPLRKQYSGPQSPST